MSKSFENIRVPDLNDTDENAQVREAAKEAARITVEELAKETLIKEAREANKKNKEKGEKELEFNPGDANTEAFSVGAYKKANQRQEEINDEARAVKEREEMAAEKKQRELDNKVGTAFRNVDIPVTDPAKEREEMELERLQGPAFEAMNEPGFYKDQEQMGRDRKEKALQFAREISMENPDVADAMAMFNKTAEAAKVEGIVKDRNLDIRDQKDRIELLKRQIIAQYNLPPETTLKQIFELKAKGKIGDIKAESHAAGAPEVNAGAEANRERLEEGGVRATSEMDLSTARTQNQPSQNATAENNARGGASTEAHGAGTGHTEGHATEGHLEDADRFEYSTTDDKTIFQDILAKELEKFGLARDKKPADVIDAYRKKYYKLYKKLIDTGVIKKGMKDEHIVKVLRLHRLIKGASYKDSGEKTFWTKVKESVKKVATGEGYPDAKPKDVVSESQKVHQAAETEERLADKKEVLEKDFSEVDKNIQLEELTKNVAEDLGFDRSADLTTLAEAVDLVSKK